MCLLLGVACWAIPADKTPMKVTQSDGSTLTLRLVGDEFFHYNTTADGYTVLRNAGGSYEYAVKQGGVLVASGMLAHDATLRTQAERQLLSQVGTHLRADGAVERARQSRAFAQKPMLHEPTVDYSNFRGLIILINYTDRQFGMNDPNDFYDKMANQENYQGFNFNGRFQRCTGSMYDYFNDQSRGIFKPQFDIVGPVNVDFASTDHGGTNNSWRIFWAALDAADEQVDFSNYDNDGDGMVDMIYFLVAGYSANYSGNNGDYLWPHKSFLYDYENWKWISYDGTYMGSYASSTEVYGWESQGYPIPIGIGTMAHEFSHVLGLPDLYDTDYSDQGQSHDPGEWDVMASGGSYNLGRTPCAYSIWERYALGWTRPTEITQVGNYSLRYVATTNDGFILRSPIEGEFFMLDNRQTTKWDAYLPGHGMLVARVDSTNIEVWQSNDVNALASRNYYELVRAGNGNQGSSSADPFPGTDHNTELSFTTTPALHTWSGLPLEFMFTNISEDDGVVSFTVAYTPERESQIENFEAMPTTSSTNETNVLGKFAKWSFLKAAVNEPAPTACEGLKSCSIISGGRIEMTTDVICRPYMIELDVFNTTNSVSKIKLLYSIDQGQTWTEADTEAREVQAHSDSKLSWSLNLSGAIRFRVSMVGGSKNSKTYLDNFTIKYTGGFETQVAIAGDVTGDGMVDISDVNAVINMMLGKTSPTPAADINSDGNVDIADVNAVINLMLGKE